MRVGVDLDGVVYPFVDALRNVLVSRGIRTAEQCPEPNIYDFGVAEWGLPDDEWPSCFTSEKWAPIVFSVGSPYRMAISGLSLMRQDYHEIHFVTHRPKPAEEVTKVWLANQGISYDSLTFSADKTVVPVDIFIEDTTKQALSLDEAGIPVVIIDRPWNQDCHVGTRVNNLVDAFIHIWKVDTNNG
jgi:hypothetical protein